MRAGDFPLVLGGDCSIQLGASLALRRIGRYGIAAIDGSADFRHTGNSPSVGAAGGEELAIATGRGQVDLSDIEGLRPYIRDEDVRLFGIRDGDEDLAELAELRIPTVPVGEIREGGAADVAGAVLQTLEAPVTDGFWVHLDADVLDPEVMPAVDAPDPGGLLPAELTSLLRVLVRSERCVGLNVTIYDPDLDPEGTAGRSSRTSLWRPSPKTDPRVLCSARTRPCSMVIGCAPANRAVGGPRERSEVCLWPRACDVPY